MSGIAFGRFAPSTDVPEGRMLATTGALTTTVSSRASGANLTLRLRCSRRDPDGVVRWPTVPFARATHMFVDDFDGEEIATFDPRHGVLAFGKHASIAAQWTVAALLRYIAGHETKLTEQAQLTSTARCHDGSDLEALAAVALRSMD